MKNIVAVALLLTLSTLNAKAADSTARSTYKTDVQKSNLSKTDDVGVGIKWGTLSGVAAKYWADENQSWELTAAFADSNTAVGADYLWNFRGVPSKFGRFDDADNLVPFAGFGLLSSFGGNSSSQRIFDHSKDSFNLAARIPLGIEYLPTSAHLGIFGEIGLGLAFVPTSYSFATADVGARYYF